MTALRLTHALLAGDLALPAGRLAVLGPPAGLDLFALGREVQVVTGFFPDHEFYTSQGFDTAREPAGPFAATLVLAARSRERTRGLVARAAGLAPLVIVEGARTDGIDSLMRDVKARAGLDGQVSKAHGRVFWFSQAADFADWVAAAMPRQVAGFQTVPGAFSADGPDPGSTALADALPPLRGRVADFGAGWGFLAHSALARSPDIAELHLIEADADALDCARVNVGDPRARFQWADATRLPAGPAFDAVISNPPFHAGRAADPTLGRGFVRAAAAALSPQGTLWLVANRHLPYESALAEAFVEVEIRSGTPAYKIFRAHRPRRRR